jgi:hypothetical protein
VTGILLAGGLLGGYECAFRMLGGYRPSIEDNANAWCLARSAVRERDRDAVVLIGASRVIMDIDTAAFSETWSGRKPIQLAVVGSDCRPMLRHLAEETEFCGIVICDVIPNTFFAEPPQSNIQVDYIQQYRQQPWLALAEQWLRTHLHARFLFRLPELAPADVCLRVFKGESLPRPRWQISHPDRSMHADFSLCHEVEKLQAQWVQNRRHAHGVAPQQLDRDLESIEAHVDRIQRRGGRVVFVHFPTSGPVRDIEEERFPRARYWDTLAAGTSGISIHSRDYPSLASFSCPDGSHLDQRDAVGFTLQFVPLMKAKLNTEPDRAYQ